MWTLARARRCHRRALRLWRAGHRAGAVSAAGRAAGLFAPHGGDELAVALTTLGDFQFGRGDLAGAAETFRRAGPRGVLALGNCLRLLGRFDEAAEVLAAATLDASAHNALGVLCKDTGRFAEAAAHYAVALRDPALRAVVHHNLAGLAYARGEYADALVSARTALALHARQHGPGSAEVAADVALLGAVLLELDRFDDAEAALRRAHSLWLLLGGPQHHEVDACRHALGVLQARR
jgi:tetratricopeptide (TPR) repeat protein